jgi:hypothetical protein
MDPFDQFEAYATIADQLINELSKPQVAECARILALQVADYRQRFGEIPHADLLHLGGRVQIGDEQAALLRDGMEVLVGYLGNVRDGVSEGQRTSTRRANVPAAYPVRNTLHALVPNLAPGKSRAPARASYHRCIPADTRSTL